MSLRQRTVQGLLTSAFALAFLLIFTSQEPVAHAASIAKSSSCASPPANFRPLEASSEEITQYGLPPKPTKEKDLQLWAQNVGSRAQRACGTSTARTNRYSQQKPIQKAGVIPNFTNATWYTWSGYATGWGYGSGFDEAYGNWHLPCLGSPSSSGYHSITWVGLGGWYNNQHLLQAGTINDPTWGLSLWWEAWPNNAIQVIPGISPRCNDQIFADVWVNYNTNTSYYYVKDITQNKYGSGQYNNFVPDRQSAEWIDERPSCASGNYTPLANFGHVDFTNSHAEVTGTNGYGTISSYRAGSVTMVSSSGSTLAQPGGLSSDGTSFRDTWYGSGTGEFC